MSQPGAKLFFAAICLLASSALALNVEPPLSDTQLEARARQLFHEIRCVTCRGETIADSPSDIAHDMRVLVRERIVAGDSDAEITGFLASRYGDGILMRTPLTRETLLLWFAPLLILSSAVLFAWSYFSRKER